MSEINSVKTENSLKQDNGYYASLIESHRKSNYPC